MISAMLSNKVHPQENKGARSCLKLPGAARSCQELQGAARSCQELPEKEEEEEAMESRAIECATVIQF
jgi:hypothetical protein